MTSGMKRQGDILFEPVEHDAAANNVRPQWLQEDGVIARGTTGHEHKVVGGFLYRGQPMVIVVPRTRAEVVHPEHGTITLEPGRWFVRRQIEYVAPGETMEVYD